MPAAVVVERIEQPLTEPRRHGFGRHVEARRQMRDEVIAKFLEELIVVFHDVFSLAVQRCSTVQQNADTQVNSFRSIHVPEGVMRAFARAMRDDSGQFHFGPSVMSCDRVC
jgi:hypothetical protein